ncbi:MAG: tRNA U34 5-methylaminomethyl-2-thiouridine-forming methyltransferase MnmC [Paraglaciecola sp.]|jgi:tRNA U34 5-methylaminomethyl-2-thiouridine-forming methyltransferase MnmC
MIEIIETTDGSHSLFSEKFGITYHSKHGAVQESQHIFIEAGLHQKAADSKELSVLEIGFGSGLNVFMTYLEAKNTGLTINIETYEIYPISNEQAEVLNYPQVLNAKNEAAIFKKIHTCEWGKSIEIANFFTFQKHQKDFLEIEEAGKFDVIYFDAFAPDAQPELWDANLLKKMYDSLKTGGVMTTYCAKGIVKRTLKSVGFETESIPGPPGKREMTRAWKR